MKVNRWIAFMLAIFFMSCCSGYCDETWVENHKLAITYIESDTSKALQHYTEAINSLTDKKDHKTLFLFLERGDLYFDCGLYSEALDDYNHVIVSIAPIEEVLENKKYIFSEDYRILFCDALFGRLQCFSKAGKIHEHLQESRALKRIDPRCPKLEETSEGDFLIKGFTGGEDEVDELKELMMDFELIENLTDIQFSPSGLIYIHPKSPCSQSTVPYCDSCAKGRECKGGNSPKETPDS